MPQLDNLIILPQIFWLIIFFGLFYFILTYYFLPLFLKAINSRKYFLENNKISESKLISEVFNKRKLILNDLNLNFNKIRSILFLKVFNKKIDFQKNFFNLKFSKLNNKLLIALNNSVLHCNFFILNTIEFYPKMLNKK